MKKSILFLIVLTLLVSICGIASAITEDEFLWTNMNNDPVKSNPPSYLILNMVEEEPIQLERITTYHWNNGEGAEPGTVSIYNDDTLLASWPAVGRSAYGTENVYWDAAVNIVLLPGYKYTVRLSDEDSWSYNAASEDCGMIEFYGHRLYEFNGWTSPKKGQTDGTQDQCAVPDPGIEVILNNDSLVMLNEKGMPTGPVVLDDTLYIPVRTVSEITGLDFNWDKETKTLKISSGPAEDQPREIRKNAWNLTSENWFSFDGRYVSIYNEGYQYDKYFAGITDDGYVRFLINGGYVGPSYEYFAHSLASWVVECSVPNSSYMPGETVREIVRAQTDNEYGKGQIPGRIYISKGDSKDAEKGGDRFFGGSFIGGYFADKDGEDYPKWNTSTELFGKMPENPQNGDEIAIVCNVTPGTDGAPGIELNYGGNMFYEWIYTYYE